MEMENIHVSGPNPDFSYFNMLKYYANISVGIATGYRLDGSGSISGTGILAPIQWVQGAFSLRLKGQVVCEAYYSPPFNVQVNSDGAIFPLPHTSYWHGA
jgi:hypothetical protein